jgi:hypothetical protein
MPNVFKTLPFAKIFELDCSELFACGNDINSDKMALRPFSTYLTKKYHMAFYRSLHKLGSGIPFRVYYLNTKLNGIERDINIIPSFHFYRKLFASELYKRSGKDAAGTVEYMKWAHADRLFDYIKMYDTLASSNRDFFQ